jgi:hypothetical protein
MKQIIYRLDVVRALLHSRWHLVYLVSNLQSYAEVISLFHRGSLPGARPGHGVVDEPWSQSRKAGKNVLYPKSSLSPIITLGYNQ